MGFKQENKALLQVLEVIAEFPRNLSSYNSCWNDGQPVSGFSGNQSSLLHGDVLAEQRFIVRRMGFGVRVALGCCQHSDFRIPVSGRGSVAAGGGADPYNKTSGFQTRANCPRAPAWRRQMGGSQVKFRSP